MKYNILKKDIVIPAGSVFYQAPHTTERYGSNHYEHTIGLSDDTFGYIIYCIEPGDLTDWFEGSDGMPSDEIGTTTTKKEAIR